MLIPLYWRCSMTAVGTLFWIAIKGARKIRCRRFQRINLPRFCSLASRAVRFRFCNRPSCAGAPPSARTRELISHACDADYANSHIFHQGFSDFLLVCEVFIQFQLPRFHGESDVEFLVRAKKPLLQKTNTHVIFQALLDQTLHFGVKLRNYFQLLVCSNRWQVIKKFASNLIFKLTLLNNWLSPNLHTDLLSLKASKSYWISIKFYNWYIF